MFSADDAKEVFQLLSSEGEFSNPLILSSRGDGFVTRQYLRRAFEDIVTKGCYTHDPLAAPTNREGYGDNSNQRITITSLARDLNVSPDTLLSLADEFDGSVILRSSNGREIITEPERDEVDQDLQEEITFGLISKDEFARKHHLSHSSLDLLVHMSEIDLVEVNGYLCSTSYEMTVSSAIANYLRKHLQELQ